MQICYICKIDNVWKLMKSTSLLVSCLAVAAVLLGGCGEKSRLSSCPEPMGYESITVNGALKYRLLQNLERLKAEEYQPANVFNTEESGGWPGDIEGKTILGLVCDASAAHQPTGQLTAIISKIPDHLNNQGYMGPEYEGCPNERQLSGNGWMLRGLCAYYEMSSDKRVLDWIRSISENLFVKGKGLYKTYHTDTGSLFIGMDGLIDAYRLVGTPEMKEVIEEMIERFLEMDLVAVQAQTHASLTGCRGLVRFAEMTGNKDIVQEAEKRWETYKRFGMTENYESYGRFGCYDAGTEPCATVDSYMLALKLWQHTGNNAYLSDAQMIFYNGLAHTQRANGGFGSDSCPGEASGPDLSVTVDESQWCCTMRGAEGLATAAAFNFMRKGDTFYLTDLNPMSLSVDGLELELITNYPFEGSLTILLSKVPSGKDTKIKIFVPDWMKLEMLETWQGMTVPKVGEDGFLTIGKLREGGQIILEYSYGLRQEPAINPDNTKPGQVRYFNGPFILNEEGNPIYHLMDPMVCKDSTYSQKILFNGL